jgi:hypothetical protein
LSYFADFHERISDKLPLHAVATLWMILNMEHFATYRKALNLRNKLCDLLFCGNRSFVAVAMVTIEKAVLRGAFLVR